MLPYFGIGIVLLLLFITFLFMRIYISCNIVYTVDEQFIIIRIHLSRLQVYKKVILLEEDIEREQTKQSSISHLFHSFRNKSKKFIQYLKQLSNSATILFHYVHVHRVKWHTNIGTGEASTTAVSTGSLWSLKGIITRMITGQSVLMCRPDIFVFPKYNQVTFQSTFDCMVSLNVGKAIVAIFRILKKTKIKKEVFT
ncbi:DUF2953 domain-containing protein [Virgibacillus sp. W0181]|uniref:DUF2953 domain-containing protein n=1 Tax=Virgibacillus sp. W0181 TaxID=3391581 RepID=UPI003F47C240